MSSITKKKKNPADNYVIQVPLNTSLGVLFGPFVHLQVAERKTETGEDASLKVKDEWIAISLYWEDYSPMVSPICV